MITESERSRCARCWYLKLVDNLFPKLETGNSVVAAPQDNSPEELTKVKLTAANRRHLKVVIAHEGLLKRNYIITELHALFGLIVLGGEVQVIR